MTIENDPLETRNIELQLTGLIYVRALRAAGGASAEELQRFSKEIKRQRSRLAHTSRMNVPHG
jgi:hypothetical protein